MKTGKKIAVFGNGQMPENLSLTGAYGFLIATDLASLKLLDNGIVPDVAIGDFDTVSRKDVAFLKKKIPVIRIYPSRKDETDLELALNYAFTLSPKSIDIFGATGTRLDHVLAAVFLLGKIVDNGISGRIIDNNNEISLLRDKITLSKSEKYRYFSLIPLSREPVVSIKGARFELEKVKLRKGRTVGISNEVKSDKCRITVNKGETLLVRSRD